MYEEEFQRETLHRVEEQCTRLAAQGSFPPPQINIPSEHSPPPTTSPPSLTPVDISMSGLDLKERCLKQCRIMQSIFGITIELDDFLGNYAQDIFDASAPIKTHGADPSGAGAKDPSSPEPEDYSARDPDLHEEDSSSSPPDDIASFNFLLAKIARHFEVPPEKPKEIKGKLLDVREARPEQLSPAIPIDADIMENTIGIFRNPYYVLATGSQPERKYKAASSSWSL